MTDEITRKKAFDFTWERNPCLPSSIEGYFSMRGWQTRAFAMLRDKPFMILNAPMGSGKSWMMCLLSAYKMRRADSLRTIISVPQTIIAPGFVDAKFQMPDGEFLHWRVTHNLCNKDTKKSTIQYLIDWLSNSYQNLNDRVLLCTHATLVKAYKRLKAENQLHLLNNLLLWVDEAHHVKNVAMEDIEDVVISNGMGDLVTNLLNSTHHHVQLGLTTASFFRGDRCSLLTPSMESQFKRFNLPYDEYLQSMQYLESFSFDFLLCGDDYINAIGCLVKHRKGKDIIYVPHPKSRLSTGDKYREVKRIFSEYQKIHGGELIDTSDGLSHLKNSHNDFKMLDLVDEDQRAKKKELLNSEALKLERDALDLIIALGMFKEGANWIWADRSIIVGARASLVDVVQMIGRLFRDAKDKQHVEVIQLLPFSLDQQNDCFQENLNNYLKAIYASLILEDVLNPVAIPSPIVKTKKNIDQEIGEESHKQMNGLPESTRLLILHDVVKHLTNISEINREKGEGIPVLYEQYQNILPEILQKYEVAAHAEEIGHKVWSMLLRRTFRMRGINVEDIDFEIVKITNPLEGLLRYTSDACGIETFAQLREAIRSCDDEKNARWEFNYGLLVKYTEERGNCRVHKDYEVEVNGKAVKLGSWYSDQKKNFHTLSPDKQERLQKLPGFIAKKFQRNKTLSIDDWIGMFISVSQKLGTPIIPNTHIEDGYSLGAWMQHIRKGAEWKKLSPEQQRLLLDNNFKLSPTQEWAEAATLAMSQFAAREGKTIPKTGHREEICHKGVKYSIRLDNLRNKIKKTPQEVAPNILEGISKIPRFLEELQDDMESDDEYLERGLKLYEKFKNRTNQIIVPEEHLEDGFDLAGWCRSMRKRKLKEPIQTRILTLDPYFFEKHNIRIFIQEVQPRIDAYLQEHGNAHLPQGYICADGYPLGQKVSDLRERKDKLAEPIIDYLHSLGDKWAWNYFEQLHFQGMQELISYFEKSGYQPDILPKEIRELKSKIKKVLQKYPDSKPFMERLEKLAPGIFDDQKDENYLALLRYLEREVMHALLSSMWRMKKK